MNEKDGEDSENDKILLTNDELEKELLDNPSINGVESNDENKSIISNNSEINDVIINKNENNSKNYFNNNNNLFTIRDSLAITKLNKNKALRNQSHKNTKNSEDFFERELIKSVDNEKTQRIIEMMNEDIEKSLSIVNEDMNILQRASFLNKISSVKTIIKILKNKFNNENNNISKYNDFINIKNKRGYTSLHYSIICGNLEIFIFLIKNGADRNILTNSGYNNLILACQTKRTYIFLDEIKNKIINKQLDLNVLFTIKDKSNATLLHWAAFSDYLFGVQFLLSLNDKNINFTNFINSKDNNNATALQYSLMNNSNKVLNDLILLDNIDLYNKDYDNRDCFDYAKAMNNEKFQEILSIKNTKFNKFKRFLYITILILYNILIYFITLPVINKLFILFIQLGLNFFLIIVVLIIKLLNPGTNKGNKQIFDDMLYNINENNIYREITEIIRHCPYCYFKREKTTTKHCPLCNICVEDFIIHDVFFNRCFGKKNYFLYIIFKLLFMVYLTFFITISIWSIIIKLDNKNKIVFPLIKIEFFYCELAISIISYGTIFIFIGILFFKIWSLYKECKIKKNANILRYSIGLDKIGLFNNSRKESIM